MGSLMSGWNSPRRKTKLGEPVISTSPTVSQIEEFWRKRKISEQDHLEAAANAATDAQPSPKEGTIMGSPTSDIISTDLSRSVSSVTDEDLEASSSFKDWWTKSNWAYLNEPAVKEDTSQKHYTAQFQVANIAIPDSQFPVATKGTPSQPQIQVTGFANSPPQPRPQPQT
ncbi:hypothetical protein KP509_20G059700 [Ceratopteris richardii]|uniref:Uncharacterized protein n=1 Tax=Ceratopteris richardii TaxID=49495 RepID=A0A8T2SHU3_CERRI|nr:hypothetical protein KP509_20G059700 [Ceratopteris richardii]